MARSITESMMRFEHAKQFFLHRHPEEFVAEISEQPFSSWKITVVHSIDEMITQRASLSEQHKGFCGYIHHEGHYNFYYSDANLLISQNVDSSEILHFDDRTFEDLDINKVIAELKLLQG
jgi:hypothetical protein